MRAGAIRMHVAEAGAGDPVLLLHGWPQHWYCWRRVIPRLSADHRVLCADLRGFGWSDAPRSSYAKQELADDVIALLDALELDRVRLVGHDWGAFVAFLAALRAPERFSEVLSYATERLTVPTRLVVGRSDPVITEASLDGFQAHADDMTIEVIDGGHFLPEERPDAVARRIGEMRAD